MIEGLVLSQLQEVGAISASGDRVAEMNQHLPHEEQQQEEVEEVGMSRRRGLEPLVVSRPPPGPQAGESMTWDQTSVPQ